MTTQELLKKLGLDAGLPVETLLEQLGEKNLEYLERIDACGDETRAAELRGVQEQIEAAIQSLEGGISLQKASAEPAAAAAPATPAPPAPQAPAPAPEVKPAPVSPAQKPQRELFEAAQAGDGAAALELAKGYTVEGNYESAFKWIKTAHSLKTPGAGLALLQLWDKVGTKDELLALCAEETGWLTGYDQIALCESVYDLLHQGKTSPQAAKKTSGDILALLPPDSPARDMLQEVYQQAEQDVAAEEQLEEKQRKEEKAREQARQAALERAEKKRHEDQRQAERAKAQRSRQHFWRDVFPKLFCALAPLPLAILVNELFWLIVGEGDTIDAARALIAMPLLPIVTGFFCVFLMWRLTHEKHNMGRAFIMSILLPIAANMVAFFAVVIIDKLVGVNEVLPIDLGVVQITARNAYVIPTTGALYFLCIRGVAGNISEM